MKGKKYFLISLFLLIPFIFSGCADFQKKFIRKKKPYEGPPKYYVVKEYDIHPSIELYQKRYIYWKNWHRELLADITDTNKKKSKVDMEQAISNLWDMKRMLVDEKGDELQEYINEMQQVQTTMISQSITGANQVKFRRKIEMLLAEIKKNFSYRKMEGFIRDDFRRDDQN